PGTGGGIRAAAGGRTAGRPRRRRWWRRRWPRRARRRRAGRAGASWRVSRDHHGQREELHVEADRPSGPDAWRHAVAVGHCGGSETEETEVTEGTDQPQHGDTEMR